MKNKWLIASVLIVALIGLCVASLFATWQGIKMVQDSGMHFQGLKPDLVSTKATEEKSLSVGKPVSLSVETYQGNITVQAGKDGQVSVKTETTAWGNSDADAQAALKEIKVIIDQQENTIKISIQQSIEVDMWHIGPRGGVVNFTITVPAETAVTLSSTEGDLSLSGTTGNAKLETTFGSLTITDVTGEIIGQSGNGDTTAKNIGSGEMITLSTEFGAISVDNAKGSDVTISSSNGDLDRLNNIKATGLLKATSEFGDIHITNSQTQKAEVRSSNGDIRLENMDVDGSVTVKSNFGSLTMREVNANAYDLNTQNGKISLDGARNGIKAHSDFGSVEIFDAQNASIDLSSNNGDVTFAGSLGSGQNTIESDFGSIKITLPADSALKVELQTDFGKITSDFSIVISGEIDSKHWRGTINGGGATLTVKTDNGNISLQSSK